MMFMANNILFALAQTSTTADSSTPDLEFISKTMDAASRSSIAMMAVGATAIICLQFWLFKYLK